MRTIFGVPNDVRLAYWQSTDEQSLRQPVRVHKAALADHPNWSAIRNSRCPLGALG